MPVAVTNRRWRRYSAFVQLLLFAFSASTSLLPCANDMVTGATKQVANAHKPAPSSHEHVSHASHGSQAAPAADAQAPASPSHHAPASHAACPWVVGCTGMVQFAFESSWRLVETTPIVSAPVGDVLRAVTAEREVESPPPRA